MNREIVIVGCGLSGMLTALSFANNNIKTTIIEYQSVTSDNFCDDIRTTALTPASAQFLARINIWPEVENIATKMLNVYVVDNKAEEMLHFANIKGNNALGYIVKNNEFKKILLEKVKTNQLIEIIDQFNYRQVDSYHDRSIIHFADNKTINCKLLIVCDGRASKIRQYYFFNKINKSYKQTALTFNIKHDKDHENCAIEHFMPSGPFAILPLKDQKNSSVIWTASQEQVPLLLSLPNDEFEYLVNKHAGSSLGNISIDSKISLFPLKAQITNKYFHNKIVVLADSAHIVHPLAGQGLNQGIKDIGVLTQLISSAVISSTIISEELLKQYQKLRQKDNFAMYLITDKLNSIFSNDWRSLWYLRRLGLKFIDNIGPIKQSLLQYAMGRR